MTLSGYMKEKYQSDGVKRVYLFQLIGLSVLSTGVQLLAGSQILSAVTGISFKTMTILLACIAISYSLFSGIKASMLTDAIQMVFMLVACNLEYPAFIAWIEQNKPSDLEIINTGQDMEWLKKHPDMLFPDKSNKAAQWFHIVQHRGQARYYKEVANMAAPTNSMAEAMDKYGISLTDGSGNMKTLKGVMDNLRSSLGGLSETEQTAAASTIFGKEAMSGMLAIINASEQDYNDLSNAIGNSKDAAQDMADTMLDNLAGSMTLMQSAVEGTQNSFGQRLEQ